MSNMLHKHEITNYSTKPNTTQTYTHITPTLGPLGTTMSKRNYTHATRPPITLQLDATAKPGTPYIVTTTQPTPANMLRRMLRMQPTPDTWLKNAQMRSNTLPKHLIHIIRAQVHKYRLQGPTPGGHYFLRRILQPH
jgi:hypothetical protein